MSFPAIVTIWFVDTAEPAEILNAEPKADRGFGRKLLSQINPAWPITAIGEFPLNRSSTPGRDEFYIAGYPQVAVVQTFVEEVGEVSTVADPVRSQFEAGDTYIFAEGTDSDFAGFAHFNGDSLQRAFAATREVMVEDSGLPEPFEAPFWAGEMADQIGGIALPFVPQDMLTAAEEHWLGVSISPEGPDLSVVGYAVDGRPEPKITTGESSRTKSVAEVASRLADKDKDYDDYVDAAPEAEEGHEFADLADASVAAAKRLGRDISRRAKTLAEAVRERIRHSDRG